MTKGMLRALIIRLFLFLGGILLMWSVPGIGWDVIVAGSMIIFGWLTLIIPKLSNYLEK